MPEYVLGTDEQERIRLGLQHRLWSACAHQAWERAGLRPEWRVLDVGCGPGWASLDMAQIVGPAGSVFGVDESDRYVQWFNQAMSAAGLPWASAVPGDVHQIALAAAGEAPFDMGYVRWVLCFVQDPGTVVAQVAELLKPGGRLVIQDYFNYECMSLAPRREAFSRGIQAVAQSWRDRGGNPDVMGGMPALLRKAGLRIIHREVIQRFAHPHEQMWTWPTVFWKTFMPRLEEAGYLTAQQHQAFDQAWADATNDPDSFIHLPTVYELIAEKP
ncbi:MAG: methyltransferase domain-containing protein [Phycisphaerales bacterium]|nr:methyltransferase domain-containing protein [Phycisphaerales bacterium]